jgi:hypothetical protein
MATFIELRTDAFVENLNAIKQEKLSFEGVRRPLRGIEIKEDTYAVMRVIKSDGTNIALLDSSRRELQSGNETAAASGVPSQIERSKGNTYNYSNFIIQSVNDSRQEKQQIMETFGDSYIFFFGERPRILQVQGLLFNTHDFNWRTEFWYNYENTLRGSKLVEQNARVYLHWDDIVVEGYIMGAMAQDDASMPYHISFSFSLFVTNHIYLSAMANGDFPVRSSAFLAPLQSVSSLGSLQGFGLLDEEVNKQLQEASDIARAARGQRQPVSATNKLTESTPLTTAGAIARLSNAGNTSKFNVGKNLLANAIAVGVQAQNLTFLSLVNRFFNQRRMKFPRGIAGADTVGPQFSGITRDKSVPERKLKLRSKIRDNTDEYVKGAWSVADHPDVKKKAQQRIEKLTNKAELENNALRILSELGIDPIQHGKPENANIFTRAYNITTASTSHDAGELNAFDAAFVDNASNLGFV